MNKHMLRKNNLQRFTVWPPPRQLTSERWGLALSNPTFVGEERTDGYLLTDESSQLTVRLGWDHIREFMTGREEGGLTHGSLILKVQVFMEGRRSWVEPLAHG